jgi:hypothetical protein
VKAGTLAPEQAVELRAKAAALDEAVEWMDGIVDSEKLMTVCGILANWRKRLADIP